MGERFERYRGPVKRDFLGESHMVNGEWVRQGFSLSSKERLVYRAYGKFFQKIEAQNTYRDWTHTSWNLQQTSQLSLIRKIDARSRSRWGRGILMSLIDENLQPNYNWPLLTELTELKDVSAVRTDYPTKRSNVVLTLITKNGQYNNVDFIDGYLTAFSEADLLQYKQSLQKSHR